VIYTCVLFNEMVRFSKIYPLISDSELSKRRNDAEVWIMAAVHDDRSLVKRLIQLGSDLRDGYLWLSVALMCESYEIIDEVCSQKTINKTLLSECLLEDDDSFIDILLNAPDSVFMTSIEAYIENASLFPESPLMVCIRSDRDNNYILMLRLMMDRLLRCFGQIHPSLIGTVLLEMSVFNNMDKFELEISKSLRQ